MISHRNKIIDFILETPLNGEKGLLSFILHLSKNELLS